MKRVIAGFLLATAAAAQDEEYVRRVAEVTRTQGLVALWDFVRREPGGQSDSRHTCRRGRESEPSSATAIAPSPQ